MIEKFIISYTSLVIVAILMCSGQLKVQAFLINATITDGMSLLSVLFFSKLEFLYSQSNKKVSLPLEFHDTSLSN